MLRYRNCGNILSTGDITATTTYTKYLSDFGIENGLIVAAMFGLVVNDSGLTNSWTLGISPVMDDGSENDLILSAANNLLSYTIPLTDDRKYFLTAPSVDPPGEAEAAAGIVPIAPKGMYFRFGEDAGGGDTLNCDLYATIVFIP